MPITGSVTPNMEVAPPPQPLKLDQFLAYAFFNYQINANFFVKLGITKIQIDTNQRSWALISVS